MFVNEDDGTAYFKAKDVAEVLAYRDTVNAIKDHVWEKNKIELCDMHQRVRVANGHPYIPFGIHPQTVFLNEPGVYQLIFSSKTRFAMVFQDWVFSEILPSIRETGSYSTPLQGNASINTPAAIEGTDLEKLESVNLDGIPKYDSENSDDEERIKANKKAKSIVERSRNEKAARRGKLGGSKMQGNRRQTIINLRMAKDEIEGLVLKNEELMLEIETLKEAIRNLRKELEYEEDRCADIVAFLRWEHEGKVRKLKEEMKAMI